MNDPASRTTTPRRVNAPIRSNRARRFSSAGASTSCLPPRAIRRGGSGVPCRPPPCRAPTRASTWCDSRMGGDSLLAAHVSLFLYNPSLALFSSRLFFISQDNCLNCVDHVHVPRVHNTCTSYHVCISRLYHRTCTLHHVYIPRVRTLVKAITPRVGRIYERPSGWY